jgi:putative glycerol-1-phosphate prenyltransferase
MPFYFIPISGRNPDYLIDQVDAAPILKKTNLEVISTGYMLIESGGLTAAVSKTKPLSKDNISTVATAQG